MNVVVGVISPAPAWTLPRRFIDDLRRDFPQHAFLDAWDRDTLRRLLPEADVAFTPFVDRDLFPSLPRLRWVQSPAVGVGSLMFPELLASAVVLTSARELMEMEMDSNYSTALGVACPVGVVVTAGLGGSGKSTIAATLVH